MPPQIYIFTYPCDPCNFFIYFCLWLCLCDLLSSQNYFSPSLWQSFGSQANFSASLSARAPHRLTNQRQYCQLALKTDYKLGTLLPRSLLQILLVKSFLMSIVAQILGNIAVITPQTRNKIVPLTLEIKCENLNPNLVSSSSLRAMCSLKQIVYTHLPSNFPDSSAGVTDQNFTEIQMKIILKPTFQIPFVKMKL